jgi:hypothetical protein
MNCFNSDIFAKKQNEKRISSVISSHVLLMMDGIEVD